MTAIEIASSNIGFAFWCVAWLGMLLALLHTLRGQHAWALNAMLKALALAILAGVALWFGNAL